MKATAFEPADPSTTGLSNGEQRDFELIVDNAKSMGWLPREGSLVATRDSSGILVRAVNDAAFHERRYDDGHRWLLQLLHELAQGMWKLQRAHSV